MKEIKDSKTLGRLAEAAVPDDVDLWPGIRSQVGSRRAPTPRRRLAFGAVGAVMLALIIGAAFLFWAPARPADAQAILDKAQAAVSAPASVASYHLRETAQAGGKGGAVITTEVWFDGATHQRSVTETRDGNGELISVEEKVQNGRDNWIALTQGGQTRVVHATDAKIAASADAPGQESTLAGVLAAYSSARWCMNARTDGEAAVAGRAAYVIALSPIPGGCEAQGGKGAGSANVQAGKGQASADIPPAKATAAAAEGARPVRVKDEDIQTRIWVDEATFLPLKMEMRGPDGTLMKGSEVTEVQYNISIDPAVFDYTPPAGAVVSNFTGAPGEDLKQLLNGRPAGMPAKP